MSKDAIPILFLDHAQAIGGAENSLLLLINNLDVNQWQPHLATTNGRFAQAAQSFHIPTHLLEFPQLRRSTSFAFDWWKTAQQVAALAQSLDIKIVHANTIRASLYTSLAVKLSQRPFIWHMRDFWLSENEPQRKWLDRWGKWLLSRMAAVIIANSQATASHLPASAKVIVVHNGIDLTEFDQMVDGHNFRQQYNIPTDTPLIGMVGRLRPWKGQSTFLHIAAQFSHTHPQTHFLIVGGNPFTDDDSYAQELQQLACELNLTDKVTFTGQITDIQSALAAMDIFVHPGEPEPFGLVNIEAMAMQKPVIAFAHGALPEIVVDGETGFLVPPYDLAAMATQITTLLKDENLRIRLGQNGRKRIETHFTIQQTAVKITKIYEQILNNE